MNEVKNEDNYSILDLLNKYYSPKVIDDKFTKQKLQAKYYDRLEEPGEAFVLGYN
ncbi:hypothetical protein RGQ13_10290 [Thalassotalea psychrophila]|uniref:Uncharacterized protein n=1 Tax=Thalassotalea psychrophila TaxID=3065647 RepID=A0ABY9TPN9_9GAMM|nr:hypothetical protein RGQ13_10290 [Colwelliaceae bacterium SQ149]